MGLNINMDAGAGVLSKAQLEARWKWSNDIERVSRWTKWLLIKQLLPQPRSVFYALCWPSKHHPINHLWLDKDGKKRKWKRKVKAPISQNLKSGNSMKSPRVLVESWKFEVFTFFLQRVKLFILMANHSGWKWSHILLMPTFVPCRFHWSPLMSSFCLLLYEKPLSLTSLSSSSSLLPLITHVISDCQWRSLGPRSADDISVFIFAPLFISTTMTTHYHDGDG